MLGLNGFSVQRRQYPCQWCSRTFNLRFLGKRLIFLVGIFLQLVDEQLANLLITEA
jgi:hypothetical protein